MLGLGSTAVTQPNINAEVIKDLPLPVPPYEEQQEIVRCVEALFKTADALEGRYRTAKAYVDKLTQSILAKAFRGELVPQDPNDEPAEKLLERIRSERENGAKPRSKTKKQVSFNANEVRAIEALK
ncbi:MAG: restriction endonuclease subunit S [Pyrinomonadaceae bacterium]|jgi:type I restriction enzyme S subunit|nr:restriction endonuclease subunit S [Pyrinomonadaceae bacterium]